jgi:hypothetical protein
MMADSSFLIVVAVVVVSLTSRSVGPGSLRQNYTDLDVVAVVAVVLDVEAH